MDDIDKKLFSRFLKRRTVPFGQLLGDASQVVDDALAQRHLLQALPFIGEVVFAFSALERMLAIHLCQAINDRSDEPGMIVLHGMLFRQRVELFDRFSRSFHAAAPGGTAHALLDPLVKELRDIGELRNRVVHADWGSLDDGGFAFVRVAMTATGLHEEHMQVDQESLVALVGRITAATASFDAYVEALEEARSAR